MPVFPVTKGVYVVGGAELSHSLDAYIYLVKTRNATIMIDSGTGLGYLNILSNLLELKISPKQIKYLIITHCHIDHAGGAYDFYNNLGVSTVAHELDANAIRKGDLKKTAADLFNIPFTPTPVTLSIRKSEEELNIDCLRVLLLHTPGHTPGSLTIYLEMFGDKIVFGGDIIGFLSSKWGSNEKQWSKSIEKVLTLDFNLLLLGHAIIRHDPKEYLEKILDFGSQWIS